MTIQRQLMTLRPYRSGFSVMCTMITRRSTCWATDSLARSVHDKLGVVRRAGRRGAVRLYADCGRVEFDTTGRVRSVACPAVLCGSVPVVGKRISPHQTWDDHLCRWSGQRIIDDTARLARVVL